MGDFVLPYGVREEQSPLFSTEGQVATGGNFGIARHSSGILPAHDRRQLAGTSPIL